MVNRFVTSSHSGNIIPARARTRDHTRGNVITLTNLQRTVVPNANLLATKEIKGSQMYVLIAQLCNPERVMLDRGIN